MRSLFAWKDSVKPYEGQTRMVKRFLLEPLNLNGETRWLGSEFIRQEYCSAVVALKSGFLHKHMKWCDKEWAE